MCEVVRNAELVHATHERTAPVGETALLDPVRGARVLVVEEVRQTQHAHAALEQGIDLLRARLERVRALDPQESTHGTITPRMRLDERVEVATRPHPEERAMGA